MTNHMDHGHAATPAARAACRKAALIALADAVDARRKLVAHRQVRKDNNPTWRKLSRAAMDAEKTYAALVNMNVMDASDKVRAIAEIPVVEG